LETTLVITSDWAVSDASLAASRAGRAIDWLAAVRRGIIRAGCGRDGRYRPLPAATLIFAGDTFDWLLSDAWAGDERPWHVGRRAAAARMAVAVGTLRAAATVARTLRHWSRSGLPVPATTGRGRPAAVGESKVSLNPILLAGDRDRWLPELAAAGRFRIRVGEEWSDGRRLVRHGHDLDPLTHPGGQPLPGGMRPPTLAESLTVDLVVPFAVAARDQSPIWPFVRPVLTRLSAARPSAMPAVVSALTRAGSGGAGRSRLASLWQRSVARWHTTARRDTPACEAEFDVIDELAAWLERLEPDADPTPAVGRLDLCHPSRRQANEAAAPHPAASPAIIISPAAGGHGWQELLDPPSNGPAVVAVGGTAPGGGYVDAA